MKNVAIAITQSLMAGLQEKPSFKSLVEKHTFENFDDKLNESDEKVQMLYRKLFAASLEFIGANSMPTLGMTLIAIETDTGDPNAKRRFLGSFVLSEAEKMQETLLNETAASLEDTEIWADSESQG